MHISRLEPVPLRELWPNEAKDFTAWLAENLDFLGEILEVDLSVVEQEASAGAFSADILAEDGSGNPVIIENQLERTDHDHLGKLITYLSNLDAKMAVWVTREPPLARQLIGSALMTAVPPASVIAWLGAGWQTETVGRKFTTR